VNSNNPCRCHKKTKGFIKAGWVNEANLQFNNHFINRLSTVVSEKVNQCDNLMEERYALLFKEHPYYDKDKSSELVHDLLSDKELRAIFEL
jgi:hypothetical protein